ncbi:MAG: DmsE family decaheme c-type cytochrome [Blastocatellia bacterium]|nr:DmsE family decaheme c-type cytochrome [Blastocatellia bacterium]
MRILKLALVVIFFVVVAVPLVSTKLATLGGGARPPAVAGTVNAQKAPFSSDPSLYVANESCEECHTNQAAHYALTAHSKTNLSKGSIDMIGCQACHGGAKAHVDYYQTAARFAKEGKDAEAAALFADEAKAKAASMRSISSLSSAESSALCLRCHEGSQGRSDERFNYRRSEHARHGVSCLDCHSSHSPKRSEALLRDTEPNMCYQCHAEQKATFAKPFHHKVPEGGMKCSDCHNQHGGFLAKSLRNSVNGDQMCVKCHSDKQGPFVYEHAPVKIEGCQTCHTPHGSTNPKLLTRNVVRFLCLECHSNTPGIVGEGTGLGPPTPSFHDITNPRYANCTVCHIEIHGSNKDPFFR